LFGLKLSPREQRMAFLAGVAFVFLIFWYVFLDPLLISINNKSTKIAKAQLELKQLNVPLGKIPVPLRRDIQFFPRETQLTTIVGFINSEFKQYGMELVSLHESADKNELSLNLEFITSYDSFIKFLESFPESKTLLIVDQVNLNDEGGQLVVEMTLLTGYR